MACLSIFALVLLPLVVVSQAPFTQLPTGGRIVLAGHSFFIPIARTVEESLLGRLEEQEGVCQFSAPQHEWSLEFAGGASGSPGNLWRSPERKQAITTLLQEGDIEVFGLTIGSDSGDNELSGISVEDVVGDFKLWFDLALEYNPKVAFFIGIPWLPEGPSAPSATAYEEQIMLLVQGVLQYVLPTLRGFYPDNPVLMLGHAVVVSDYLTLFRDEERRDALTGITSIVGAAETALFTDTFGHAGTLTMETLALLWLRLLYGWELPNTNCYEAVLGSEAYNATLVRNMVETVWERNSPFLPDLLSGEENERTPQPAVTLSSPTEAPSDAPATNQAPALSEAPTSSARQISFPTSSGLSWFAASVLMVVVSLDSMISQILILLQ